MKGITGEKNQGMELRKGMKDEIVWMWNSGSPALSASSENFLEMQVVGPAQIH